MDSPVRFGILGFGHHAKRRLVPAFAKCDTAVLNGIWRRNQVTAAQNSSDFKIPLCFETAADLCSSPEIDVVFITSPDAMHYEDTLLAFKNGKAVLCEKPLSMHASEAAEMVERAGAAKLLFGVAQNFRYNHSLEWMREQVVAGRIGTLQTARAVFNYPADRAPRTWITDLELACGGPIADVGVHCIDALRYLLDANVVSVTTLAKAMAEDNRVEAYASLQLTMTNNIFAAVEVSARSPYRTLVEVTGSEGVLTAESGFTVDRPIDVVLRRGGEIVEVMTVDNQDGYTRMLESFAAAYRGGKTFRASGADGLHNMRALDAAYVSWRESRAVSL